MVEMTYQNLGVSWAVALRSADETELMEQFYSLWNHGATNKELLWIEYGTWGYFWTNPGRFQEALVNAELAKILNYENARVQRGLKHQFKGRPFGAILLARKRAQEIMDDMVQTKILVPIIPYEIPRFSMGKMEAERTSINSPYE